MRILLLSRYGQMGPSSRLRHYQFLPALRAAGMAVDVAPLLPDSYVSALYSRESRRLPLIAARYADRLYRLWRAKTYDLLWIEKEALPWLPYGLERLLLGSRIPYVVDYDDAWFHIYDRSRWSLVRALLGRKLDRIMQGAAMVTVGNAYLAERAEKAGARQVEILPTVVDLARYPKASPPGEDGSVTVGWIGSPITDSYLDLVAGSLGRLRDETGARVMLVGASPTALEDLQPSRHAWREDTESHRITEFDIGIMPLKDTPWEWGKCGYKLIQYMACGKPVVASPVGMNRDIVENGINGFLASTPEEWMVALRRLALDAGLRRRLGAAGRAKVERLYALDHVVPRLIHALRIAANQGDGPCPENTEASGREMREPRPVIGRR